MSWFFGKKKQRDSPPSSDDEAAPVGQGEGFIFVERGGNQPGPGPMGISEGVGGPGGNLYPNISNVPQYPPPAAETPKQSLDPIQNILNDLPFKLCKQLLDNVNDDIEIDRHRVNEILAYILRLENDDRVYDFSLEKSVINEMDSAESAM